MQPQNDLILGFTTNPTRYTFWRGKRVRSNQFQGVYAALRKATYRVKTPALAAVSAPMAFNPADLVKLLIIHLSK